MSAIMVSPSLCQLVLSDCLEAQNAVIYSPAGLCCLSFRGGLQSNSSATLEEQLPTLAASLVLANLVQAASVRGAHTIIGVDRVQSRLDLVKEMGATHVIDTSKFQDVGTELPAAIRKIAPKGANAVFDTTGVVDLIAAAVPALQARGQIILIGIVNGKTIDLDLGALLNVSPRYGIIDRELIGIRSARPFGDASRAMPNLRK
jgi:NADPH:quinone reductase-like Zn-dependent oxidoreductase